MSHIRTKVWIAAWLALAGVCAFAFYDRYWRWRDCFNELGRCYDPASQQVFVENAGAIWGSLTLLCAIFALIAWRRARQA